VIDDVGELLEEIGFDPETSVLTYRQAQVLALRERGVSQADIAEALGTSRANVSSIESSARENVSKARETVAFAEALRAPVRVRVPAGTDLYDVPQMVYDACDEAGVKVDHTAPDLMKVVGDAAGSAVSGRQISTPLIVGVTSEEWSAFAITSDTDCCQSFPEQPRPVLRLRRYIGTTDRMNRLSSLQTARLLVALFEKLSDYPSDLRSKLVHLDGSAPAIEPVVRFANDVLEDALVDGLDGHGLLAVLESPRDFLHPLSRRVRRGQLRSGRVDRSRFLAVSVRGMGRFARCPRLFRMITPSAGPSYQFDCGTVYDSGLKSRVCRSRSKAFTGRSPTRLKIRSVVSGG